MKPTNRSSVRLTARRLLAGTLIASQSLLTFPIQTLIAAQQAQTQRIPDPPVFRVYMSHLFFLVPSVVFVLFFLLSLLFFLLTRLLSVPLFPVCTPFDALFFALASVLRA